MYQTKKQVFADKCCAFYFRYIKLNDRAYHVQVKTQQQLYMGYCCGKMPGGIIKTGKYFLGPVALPADVNGKQKAH